MREMQAAIEAAHPSLTPLLGEHPTERLTALSTAINVYIAALMQFFARNVERSVLRSALADPQEPKPSNHTHVPHPTQ
jgi:hypothetical protein